MRIAELTRCLRAAHLLLSHTDWTPVETCPCPPLLLKTLRPYGPLLVLAAAYPGYSHDNPAALDEQMLHCAARVGQALSGSLEVIHARTPWAEITQTDVDLRDPPEHRDEQIHQEYLARSVASVAERSERHRVTRTQVHAEDGHAAEVLPHYAQQHHADIVTLCAVSRSR